MKKSKWRRMLKDIFYEEISPRLKNLRHRLHWHEREFYDHEMRRLYEATRTISLINQSNTSDATSIFTMEHLISTTQNVKDANAHINIHDLKQQGILEVFDEYRNEILSELEIDDIPEEDFVDLSQAGIPRPKSTLRLRIQQIKEWNVEIGPHSTSSDFKSVFSNSVERADGLLQQRIEYLKKIEIQIKENPESNNVDKIKRPKRRWFKGIGSIARGTILTGFDTALLVGGVSTGFSNDTIIVGGVTSIVTGLSDIAIGVGEFRDE